MGVNSVFAGGEMITHLDSSIIPVDHLAALKRRG
jgi:hypothetical protein